MRYKTISKECVKRLSALGYPFSEGDISFIDELTMMVLTEDAGKDGTDEELVQRIIRLARIHLDPVPVETPMESAGIRHDTGSSQGLLSRMARFLSSWWKRPLE